MGLIDWLKGSKKEETKTEIVEIPKTEPRVIPKEDTLDLGWYWSENKDEFQMAKIKEKDRRQDVSKTQFRDKPQISNSTNNWFINS